jgi:hypothetical protein
MLAMIADLVFDRNDVRFKTAATEASDKEQAQAIGLDGRARLSTSLKNQTTRRA